MILCISNKQTGANNMNLNYDYIIERSNGIYFLDEIRLSDNSSNNIASSKSYDKIIKLKSDRVIAQYITESKRG